MLKQATMKNFRTHEAKRNVLQRCVALHIPRTVGFSILIITAFLLAGCGGSAIPQDEIPTTDTTIVTQQTQAVSTPTGGCAAIANGAPGGTGPCKPSDGWTLHITAKKLFPGSPDTTVHKYCKTVVGNMSQCQLYNGNDSDSRLVGVETIVGPEMYGTFTDTEKKMWMPTKDLLLTTAASMPEADAQQFANVAQSYANNYSKVYLLWDPGRLNIPTGSPLVTVMNTAVASGSVAGSTATPPLSGATAGTEVAATTPVSNGGFTFATFDIGKLLTAGLSDKKGNFETSVLQRNNVGSLELYKLKDRIGLHSYTNTTHLMFIVSGKGEFTIGDGRKAIASGAPGEAGSGKKVPVNGGMVVVIPSGTPHVFKNLGGKDTPLVFVTFKNPYDEAGVKWLE